MNGWKLAALGAAALGLAACGNVDAAHLIFGQQQVVGLDITATAPEQGGTLSLGYKDKNIAIVPVAIKGDDGKYGRYGGTNKLSADADINDAYSTIGQFELGTGGNGATSVGLGKFFATGVAAQKLADGFKAKLAK
jgi:hypothetical protein